MKKVNMPTRYKIYPAPIPVLGLILMLLFTFTQAALAVQKNEPSDNAGKKKGAADLKITSDKMVASRDQSMVVFTGHVKVVRAESVLLANSVKVFLHTSKNKKRGRSGVKRILAAGRVTYTEGERKALADQADYDTSSQILVLTGEQARLLTGKSWISGKKITLFRAEDRVMVESTETSRVEAFFDADDQDGSLDAP